MCFTQSHILQNGRKTLFPDLSSECIAYSHYPFCLGSWRQLPECSQALPCSGHILSLRTLVCLGDVCKQFTKFITYTYLLYFSSLCFIEMERRLWFLRPIRIIMVRSFRSLSASWNTLLMRDTDFSASLLLQNTSFFFFNEKIFHGPKPPVLQTSFKHN